MTERVAVVGLGAMGSRIARRLLDAGYELIVWNRTAEKTRPLVELGATAAASPADAAARAEGLITMLASPAALEAVTDGPDGIAAGAHESLAVIEMSTVGPAAVTRLRSALPAATELIDAPVLGSLSEVEVGTLEIFVGGPERVFERWKPVLSVLGSPMRVGPLGSGAAAKVVANTTLLGVLGLLGEALALARGLGLSQDTAFAVLAKTPLAAQAERRRPTIEKGEYEPPRFTLALARKDADVILEAAESAGVDLKLAQAARAWFAAAEDAGLGQKDYSAVLAQIIASGEQPA